MQSDRYSIDTECLDWLLEIDLPLFDPVALLRQRLCDVARSDRDEKFACLASSRGGRERYLLALARVLLCRRAARFFGSLEALALLFDALLVARRRFIRVAARKEEVARVTG